MLWQNTSDVAWSSFQTISQVFIFKKNVFLLSRIQGLVFGADWNHGDSWLASGFLSKREEMHADAPLVLSCVPVPCYLQTTSDKLPNSP